MNNHNKKTLKRTIITLETKIAILNRLAEGEGSTALGKEFNLGESTIRAIQKRASKINETNNCATNASVKRASYSRNIVIEKTEKALLLWIKESIRKRIPIDGELIKQKAKQLFNQLKDLEPSTSSSHSVNLKFSSSNGWLAGFFKRHELHNVKMQSEAASADETAARNYYKNIKKIINDKRYCPYQVVNTDEIGLLWKKMPSRTVIGKSEKTASGFKAAKERNDSEILHILTDHEDGEEEFISLTPDNIYAGIQLSIKLEKHFLKIDNNSERSSKFQKDIRSCISCYRDVYNQLIKRPSFRRPITDYMITDNNSISISSSDESNFEPDYHKKMRVLDNDA